MGAEDTGGSEGVLGHVVVPVANANDARTTARALEHSTRSLGAVTVLFVVEKGGGVPDKTPVEQSELVGADAFAAFHETFPEAEEKVVYARDVAAAVNRAAGEVDATAVAFRPRGGSRLVQFLAGDTALRLVTESDRPVVALPEPSDSAAGDAE